MHWVPNAPACGCPSSDRRGHGRQTSGRGAAFLERSRDTHASLSVSFCPSDPRDSITSRLARKF
eukprot:4082934-Prymnesium_polylepis.1